MENLQWKIPFEHELHVIKNTAACLHYLCSQLAWARKHAVSRGDAPFCQNLGGMSDHMTCSLSSEFNCAVLYVMDVLVSDRRKILDGTPGSLSSTLCLP
jgi:hypothetical protein